MDYKFPVIAHLNDVLPYVKDRKEFVVAERDGFTVVNYNMVTPETFGARDKADFIRRECRGITFHKDGTIAARKFHKFFNVNERPETQFHEIDLDKPHIILEKLDGSMITPFVLRGVVSWHTKMGATDIAEQVKKFMDKKDPDGVYYEFCRDMSWDHESTPIFEWCSRQNRIVIDYPKDRLVLVAIRENVTGEYWPYDEVLEAGENFDIPVVKAHKATFNANFLDEVRDMIGVEGFVVRFDDGHMVKIKAEDYLKLHKAKDAISQEKNVWTLILDADVDDLKGFLLPEDRKHIEAFEKQLWIKVNNLIDIMDDRMNYSQGQLDKRDFTMFDDPIRERKKMFALEYSLLSCDQLKPVMYRIYDGAETREVILDWIRNNLGTATKLEKIRWLVDVQFKPGFVEE